MAPYRTTVLPTAKARPLGRFVRDWGMLTFAAAMVVGAIAASALTRPTKSIEQLPGDAQRALYDRTMENLRTVCAQPGPDLRDYCAQEASVALRLPQCDADCNATAKRFTTRPTR